MQNALQGCWPFFVVRQKRKAGLHRNRREFLALEVDMVAKRHSLLTLHNTLFWVRGESDPPNMQFEFNGLWFDAPFTVLEF